MQDFFENSRYFLVKENGTEVIGGAREKARWAEGLDRGLAFTAGHIIVADKVTDSMKVRV